MMFSKLTLAAGVTAAAAFPTLLFSTSASASQTTRPLAPVAGALEATAQEDSESQPLRDPIEPLRDPIEIEERYRFRLVAPDLDDREAAFDQIAQEASVDPNAREALRLIAEDVGDPDLAFTARLALREASRWTGATSRSLAPQRGGSGSSDPDPFAALQERMDEVLRSDPFLRDFLSGDPFEADPFFGRSFGGPLGGSRLFGRQPRTRLFGGSGDPFEEMRQRTEEIRKQFERLRSGQGGPSGQSVHPSPFSSSSSSMSIEKNADGVRVEITEDDGSGPSTRVYEAPSMEALLEANPELKGRVR